MENKTIHFEPPEPKLTLFNATREHKAEVIFVNEALLRFEHTEIFPWHLSIEIDYTDFADNEMPTPAESERLNAICDQIEPAVLEGRSEFNAVNALFLARSTWAGIRELAFQVHDPEIAHAALQRLLDKKDWELEWQYEMRNDPTWEDAGYFFKLFPLAKGYDG